MKKQIISQASYKVSKWSGGETTEVFLYPPEGHYALDEFDYRVSTAKVELAESTFSSLPGYKRIIMSLDNPLELHHKGKESLRKEKLAPYQTDYFSGDDETKSFGKCTDFNLIYSPKFGGEMKTKQSDEVIKLKKQVTYVLYALKDVQITFNQETKTICLEAGTSLVLEEIKEENQVLIHSTTKNKAPVLIEISIR
ncbi:HutD/Ves family protein [Vagococcus carniphilus]|uniref:HutD/Ves family protein n=1 Tax=Vagococcus carniphilus TaxID=218144 RepID=UPI002891EF9F|nr:HutD family protein [Vagococcus carniphilus]MDT2863916.1 HutD family protein [Vagococcus carniphilus]